MIFPFSQPAWSFGWAASIVFWGALPSPAQQSAAPVKDEAPREAAPDSVRAIIGSYKEGWRNYRIVPLESLPPLLDEKTRPPALSPYGGRQDLKFKATGFFRIEKTLARTWLVDPDGCAFLSVGVNTFRCVPPDIPEDEVRPFYKSPEEWAETEAKRLREYGVNTAGAWSDDERLRKSGERIAYCTLRWPGRYDTGPLTEFSIRHGIGVKVPGHHHFQAGIWPVFTPAFAKYVEEEHAVGLASVKDDPWLMGWFLDNELTLPSLEGCLAYQGDDPNLLPTREVAKKWLAERHADSRAKITRMDEDAWAGYVFGQYLSVVVPVLRKHDPNHLVLGPRLFSSSLESKPVFEAVGRYCDAVSVHIYGSFDAPAGAMANWAKWSGKPVLVTEFYAKGADTEYTNTTDAGYLVPTQADRGRYYENFALGCLRQPQCIGWHWHSYMDNDPRKREFRGDLNHENRGLVTTGFKPYEPCVRLMSRLNHLVYNASDLFIPLPP